jgi:hypothetical protein
MGTQQINYENGSDKSCRMIDMDGGVGLCGRL